MKTSPSLPFVVLTLSLAGLPAADADVKLPALFSDHAIFQRGQPVPVWGTADAGEEVTLEFAGQKQTTKAGADGKWKVALKPLKEAESLVLTVKGKNTLTINDVAVGEVWVNSGQSNMASTLNRDAKAAESTAASEDEDFMPAKAEIKGETVILSAEAVAKPSATAGRMCPR